MREQRIENKIPQSVKRKVFKTFPAFRFPAFYTLLSAIRYLLSAICYLLFSIPYPLSPIPCLYGAFESFCDSPRVLAMSGASVALSDDASGINTNPAGLVQLEKSDLLAVYSNLYDTEGLSRVHLAFATPAGNNAAGISFNRLSLSGVYDEDVITVAFARQLSDYLSCGISVKLFSNEVYAPELPVYKGKKYAGTYDLGLLYQASESWILGLVGTNLNEPTIAEGEKNNPVWKIGARFHPFETGLIVCDYDTYKKSVSVGFEVILGEILPIRLGLKNQKPTFGFGITYDFISFDFAILADSNLGLLSQAGIRLKI